MITQPELYDEKELGILKEYASAVMRRMREEDETNGHLWESCAIRFDKRGQPNFWYGSKRSVSKMAKEHAYLAVVT